MNREQFPKCPNCINGRMSVAGDGSQWCDRCEVLQTSPQTQATANNVSGFPVVQSICMGCGKTLLLENAWMTDGCPCNSVLGVNSMNETRWRLLMQLQQQSQAKSNHLLFIEGAQAMREMLARFVEQGGQETIAMSIRANWVPSWGKDPGKLEGEIPRSPARVAMLGGRIRVLVDDKQVTLPGRIEGYMLKAAAGSDPHRTTWKRMPVGAPEMIVHDTTILDLVDGDEFWTSPPATFG